MILFKGKSVSYTTVCYTVSTESGSVVYQHSTSLGNVLQIDKPEYLLIECL